MNKTDSKLGLFSNLITGAAALVVTFILPLAYFAVGYQKEAAIAQTKADIYAGLVSADSDKARGAEQSIRKASIARLTELLKADSQGIELETRRVFDLENNLIAETRGNQDEPLISRTAELKSAESVFARIEITRSLRPLLIDTAPVGLLGVLLGGLTRICFQPAASRRGFCQMVAKRRCHGQDHCRLQQAMNRKRISSEPKCPWGLASN